MSETFDYNTISEQKHTRPDINDVIGRFLSGGALQNAMGFVAF